ncbi:MAG: hypothetical protein E7430_10240 [Ruminococcaceae bacterium]|nr:hypothetical protein [Oscillospiraceae bacterium]
MKKAILAIMLLVSMMLGGCSVMLEKEYVVIEPHNEQYVEDDRTDVLTVENYAGLKNAILSLVESGLEYGVIRTNNYDGDVTEDLAEASYEVARNDPLGAFAIDYLTHDYNRIVSYYELHIYITYRRTREDIDSIVRIGSDSDLKENITQLLQNFGTKAIYRFSYYDEKDYDGLVEELCAEDPTMEFGNPQIAVSLYPESGVQRIVELEVQYNRDEQTLTTMREDLLRSVRQNTGGIQPDASEEMKAYRLYRRVVDNTEFDWDAYEQLSEGDLSRDSGTDTAYDALVGRKSLSEGIAKAYYLLCRELGIECMVVRGRNAGFDYAWNIININDEYYHVDCTAEIMDDNYQGYLLTDDDMTNYRWNDELYPACDGGMSIEDVLPYQHRNIHE